jgi:hypothetical protein
MEDEQWPLLALVASSNSGLERQTSTQSGRT